MHGDRPCPSHTGRHHRPCLPAGGPTAIALGGGREELAQGGSAGGADADNLYRFLAGVHLGWAPLLFWAAATIHRQGVITYLSVGSGNLCYLATVIDLASRRLADWAIADQMRAELVIDALAAAERTRGSLAGAVLHTDQGAQYTSAAFAAACHKSGIRQSMSVVQQSGQRTRGVVQRDLQAGNAWEQPRHGDQPCKLRGPACGLRVFRCAASTRSCASLP
ncbi:transposase family protein [Streptomyces piniterrae]|uniref:Transposase family protein n=1 Tax=Streptomyces piniterrae TaxID=2571125 RepID=A0A4U0NRC8_9ACTN|nr:transposase family protein [Streptomyces piniterrae]